MASVADIIQRIAIEGDKAITTSFNRIGDAGVSAFERIQAAGQKINSLAKFERDMDNVTLKSKAFAGQIGNVAGSLGNFGSRIAVAGAGLAAVGALFAASTLKIGSSIRNINESLLAQKLASSQNAAEQKKHVQTNFQDANALEDLRLEYVKGALTVEEYSKQLRELERTQLRTRTQTLLAESEQESIRKSQAKDQANAQRRQVELKLETQFGGALATTLVNLATVLDNVRQRFFAAFGPQIAQFVTTVVTAISDAAPAVFAQFERISAAIAETFAKSNITIKDVVAGIVKFGSDIVNVIIKVVIPAVKIFTDAIGVAATIINKIFGTEFTASTLIAAAIILKLTGLFGVLTGSIGTLLTGIRLIGAAFGPWGLIITAVIVLITTQLIPLLQKIDWAAVGDKAVAVWKQIGEIFSAVVGAIKETWNNVVTFFRDKINAIIGFFDDLIRKVKEFFGITGSSSKLGKDAGLDDIGSKAPGFASGGMFRGRPGRDTNLAWMTDKEYVIKPSATKFWGTKFLAAINGMRNPFQGFNAGGLVSGLTSPMPRMAFAEGGLVNSKAGRPLILQIGDAEFEGIMVQDDTANKMARYAARRGVRSAGRKPGWFGSGK